MEFWCDTLTEFHYSTRMAFSKHIRITLQYVCLYVCNIMEFHYIMECCCFQNSIISGIPWFQNTVFPEIKNSVISGIQEFSYWILLFLLWKYMYICVFMYMYVCMHIYICIYNMYGHTCISTYIQTWMSPYKVYCSCTRHLSSMHQ